MNNNNDDNKTYTLRLFDDIENDSFGKFVDVCKEIPDNANVILQIFCYGGHVFAAFGVIDYIKSRGFKTTAQVFGVAASAAALLAISCDVVEMAECSSMMFHSVYIPDEEPDAGVERANEVQLSIIHKRCKDFSLKDLEEDKWISAKDCIKMGLADKILNESNNNYIDFCVNYLAHARNQFKNNLIGDLKMSDEIKLKNEDVVEEVKEAEEVKGEEMIEEEPSLTDIIEALAERVDRLEARIGELEKGRDEEPLNSCGDDSEKRQEARMKALYAKVCKPVAKKTFSANNEKTQEEELKDFKNRINIKEYLR